MRRLIPIVTLFIAGIVGAEPPLPNPADAVARPIELRDRTTGRQMACSCRYTGDTGADTGALCSSCMALPAEATPATGAATRPTIRITGEPGQRNALALQAIVTRVQDEAPARDLLTDLEIRVEEGFKFELILTCRNKPNDRKYVQPGLSLPMNRDVLARLVHAMAKRECASPSPVGTNAWGCPVADEYDRSGFDRTANPKIRITALVDSHRDEWSRLRFDLIADELIYTCAKEILIDPVSAGGTGDGTMFRAGMTLVCANDPTRRAEFGTGAGRMERSVFRRFIGQEIKSVCGLKAATTARQSAR